MVKNIFKSFIPFLVVLIGIFISVVLLDNYAKSISEEPEVINLDNESVKAGEDILQFETDEIVRPSGKSAIYSDSIYLQGVSIYRNSRYEESKKIFELLELTKPREPVVLNYLGLIALKENRYSKAQTYFTQAISIDSAYFTSIVNLAVVSSKMHQFRKAEISYRQAIHIRPQNPKPYYNLGLLYSSNGQWQKAIDTFNRSIELSSGSAKAKSLCYTGIAQLNLGDTLDAKYSLDKAVEYKPDYQLPRIHLSFISADKNIRQRELTKVYKLNPNSYYANYYLGLLYKENKQLSMAEFHLRKALEINPDDEKIIEELSAFLISQDRMDEAKLVIAGFSLYDTLPQTYFHEARIASKKGDIEEAFSLYKLALKKSANDYPEVALNMAILYKQINQIEKSIEYYQLAALMKSDYSAAYYNLALLYAEIGQTDDAVKNYLLAIRYNSRSSKSWYNLASIYERDENFDKAIEAYTNAIHIEPDYLKALSSLGVLYSKNKQYDKAIETYQSLLSQFPDYARGYYNLGLAYSKTKQYEKAIDAYAHVIEIDPENTKAKTNIGVLYARTNNLELSIKTFEDASDFESNNAEIRYNLALQYEKANRIDDAIYQYSRAIQLNKKYAKAYRNLIKLYKNIGDVANANLIAFVRLTHYPNDMELYELGKQFRINGEYEMAIKSFELAQKSNNDSKWIKYWEGMTYADMQESRKAILCFEEVIQSDPKHKFAYYRLGQVYQEIGLNDKAQMNFDRVLSIDPDFKMKENNQLLVEAI